jgi:hypothetical protein
MRSTRAAVATAAIRSRGWATVVRPMRVRPPRAMPSKPTTETSCGTRAPTRSSASSRRIAL